MSTEFYDDELAREREKALKIKFEGDRDHGPRDGYIPSSRDVPGRPISDLTLTPLARQKQEVSEQMVDKAQELDRLRARQEELERERRTLEELRAKQERFDHERRETKKRLNESLVRLDKEQQQSERLIQLLDETRRLFRERLGEVEEIDEQSWEDARVPDELNKVLALLEDVGTEYHQALAKLDAVAPGRGGDRAAAASTAGEEGQGFWQKTGGWPAGCPVGFSGWFRAGVAFTLPLIVALAVLVVIYGMFFWM